MMKRAIEFAEVLQDALELHGWKAVGGAAPPLAATIAVREFRLALDSGWVAVLRATWFERDAIELSPRWQRGMRHVVMIEGGVTVTAAEQLGRRFGMADCGLDISAEREFEVPGEAPGRRQFQGPNDYPAVVSEVLGYATRVLEPWARAHANLDAWLGAFEELGRDDPDLLAWEVPVMLAARGRGSEAIARLREARSIPSVAADPEFEPFAERVEQFAAAGIGDLPDVTDARPSSEIYAADRTAEDPIRKGFYEGFAREMAEESAGSQLRFGARKLRSVIGSLLAVSRGEDESWWAPVAYVPDVEEFLDEVFKSSGDPVDRRVVLQAELRGRPQQPDGQVEVLLSGRVVGVVRPEDIPTWGVVPRLEGPKRARLMRKRERPRFLLEVDIG